MLKRPGPFARRLVAILVVIAAASWAFDHYYPFDFLPRETWGPYLQDVRSDAIIIAWKSKSAKRGYVAWGADLRRPDFRKEGKGLLHAVRLRGLSPGNKYWYRVNDGGAWLGEWRPFRTAPAPGAPAAFTFAVLGDSGDGSSRAWRVAHGLARVRPDFVIHTGDVVYPNGLARDYGRGLFEPFHHTLALAPIYPAMGNHDLGRRGGGPFRDIFTLPVNDEDGTENFYSFDYGDAHFTCVNSNRQIASFEPGSPQRRWLERDLAGSHARWKIVFFHHPPFSASDRGARTKMRTLVPLFERTGVSLVLNGHAHAYERTRPIRTTRGGHPVVYVITGGGGGGLVDVGHGPDTAFSRKVYHFVVVRVTPGALHLSAIDPISGRAFDRASIPAPHVLQSGPPLIPSAPETAPGSASVSLPRSPSRRDGPR